MKWLAVMVATVGLVLSSGVMAQEIGPCASQIPEGDATQSGISQVLEPGEYFAFTVPVPTDESSVFYYAQFCATLIAAEGVSYASGVGMFWSDASGVLVGGQAGFPTVSVGTAPNWSEWNMYAFDDDGGPIVPGDQASFEIQADPREGMGDQLVSITVNYVAVPMSFALGNPWD